MVRIYSDWEPWIKTMAPNIDFNTTIEKRSEFLY